LTVMISAAKPPLSPTCSTGPHERSEPAHHLRASLVNIVATEPYFDLKPGAKEMGTPPIATPPSIANAK
jgi:hypothetical protein